MYETTSRRQFVKIAAAAVGAACISRSTRLFADDDKDDRFAGFNVGMQTYTLRGLPVDKALEQVKELGLAYVEMFNAQFPINSTDEQIAAMNARLKGLGLKCLGHGVNPFGKDHAANRKTFEFAKKAGVRQISADPSEDAFDSLDKLVAEFDIRIAIHNHGPGARYDKIADVLRAIKGRDPRIGACADLGHYIRSAEDPVRAINLLEGRLYGVHLKDFAEPTKDAKGVILGQGQLDVAATFRALAKVNFPADGSLSLEYEEHPENPIADVRACLEAASEGAKRARG